MRLLTHVYLANLIMDELVTNKGKLRIPDVKGNYSAGTLREPYPPGNEDAPKAVRFPTRGGGIEVPEAVVKVILSNREYFRGGAAGFDAFPDSAFVREVIRPFGSGIWLEYLFDRFRALPKGEERDRVYAFLIGLMTHCSASVFMRAYANEYAGGWYDGPDKPAGKKHDLIDEFVEDALARPSSKYSVVSKEERTIDIPAHFLAVCFADMSAVEDQIKRIRPEEKSGKILSAYHGSGLDPFRNSSFDYAAADGGRGTVPDPLYPKTISERIARMEKLIEKQLNDAKKVLTGEGPEKNRAEIVKLMEEQFGEEDVPKKLLNDIKEFGEAETYPYGKEGEFKAFSLGLTASKFCIIGYKELNRYLDPDPDRPETGAFGRDESRHSLKGVRLKMEPVSDLYDFFKGGTTLCGFEISAKERKAAFSAFLPSEVREGKISIDLPFPIPYEDITGFTLFMAGGEAFWDIGGFEVASETGKVLAKTTEPFRVEQNSSCSIEVNSKAVKEKVDSMGPAEAIDVPHRIMSWLYSLDGQDRDLTEKDPEYANPDRRPWEYDEYAIYSNAKEQKEEQKEFVPGLQSDLLSDEFDDIQEKPQQKEKPVSPVTKPKPKTGIPFDPSKTPEGELMNVAFEGKRVPLKKRVLPKQKKAKPSDMSDGKKKPEDEGERSMSESMEKGDEGPTKQKDRSEMDKTMDKEDSGGSSKKKDEGEMDKTMDKDSDDGQKKKESKDDGGMDKTMDKDAGDGQKKEDKNDKDMDKSMDKESSDKSGSKDDGGMDKSMDEDDSEKSSKKDDSMDKSMDKESSDKSGSKDDDEMDKSMDEDDSEKSSKKDDSMDKSMDKDDSGKSSKKDDNMDKSKSKDDDGMDN